MEVTIEFEFNRRREIENDTKILARINKKWRRKALT